MATPTGTQAVDRASTLLVTVLQADRPVPFAELAASAELPKSTASRILTSLERHGLVELVEERRKGNVTERVLQATAASYVISPAALAAVAPDGP